MPLFLPFGLDVIFGASALCKKPFITAREVSPGIHVWQDVHFLLTLLTDGLLTQAEASQTEWLAVHPTSATSMCCCYVLLLSGML